MLKHTEDDVSTYGLYFCVDDEYNGKVELKQNGSNISVTKYKKIKKNTF